MALYLFSAELCWIYLKGLQIPIFIEFFLNNQDGSRKFNIIYRLWLSGTNICVAVLNRIASKDCFHITALSAADIGTIIRFNHRFIRLTGFSDDFASRETLIVQNCALDALGKVSTVSDYSDFYCEKRSCLSYPGQLQASQYQTSSTIRRFWFQKFAIKLN